MFLRNAEPIKPRAALRPMFYSKIVNGASLKTQQKLFILHPTDLRRPYKLVFEGENPRALASRISEPVKRATFQIASGGAAQRRNHSN